MFSINLSFCIYSSWVDHTGSTFFIRAVVCPKIIVEILQNLTYHIVWPEMEFKEFEPRFKFAKTWFELSAGLNLETFDTILSGTNHI